MDVKVSVELEIGVSLDEDKEYYLDEDGTPSLYFSADLFDILKEELQDNLISVNGKTLEQIRAEINEKTQI